MTARPILQNEFERRIRESLPSWADRLIALGRPGIRLTTSHCPMDELPLGASRIGGRPDLPLGLAWPHWHDDRPLDFLAQLNLQELAACGSDPRLPSKGWLLFFWDVMDFEVTEWAARNRESWSVIHCAADVGALQRRALPFAPNTGDRDTWSPLRREGGYHCCRVSPQTEWVPAPALSTHVLEMSRAENDVYSALLDELEVVEDVAFLDSHNVHRLLGHPDPVQPTGVELEAYVKATGIDEKQFYERLGGGKDPAVMAPALQWRLLLQLYSDHLPNMMWGDCGKLYFMLTDDALANRRFEECVLVMQCT